MGDLTTAAPFRTSGTVTSVRGHELTLRGLRLAVGDGVSVRARDGDLPAEVVAVSETGASALLYADTGGIRRGDEVTARRGALRTTVSGALLGRVVDALGRPLDGGPPIPGEAVAVDNAAPTPMERQRITEPLPVGVGVVDTLCTVGRGQRMGIFAGSGVGKSTLLSMMVRGTTADVSVIALIGERGREVREFVEDDLGPDGLARSVVVVATSDEPPLVRMRAGLLATRISEWFADAGHDVLLTMDSVTRLAMAQRDIGLAAGEPPTARGYTPSVFTMLPRLLERAGPRARGTITGFYTVLVEGDDMNDPIADAARSILDGHLVLDRRLTTLGRYPPVDPLESLSRLAGKLVDPDRVAAATRIRSALAAAAEVRDLVDVGAYVPGSNPAADLGLALEPDIVAFLGQAAAHSRTFTESWEALTALAARADLADATPDAGAA